MLNIYALPGGTKQFDKFKMMDPRNMMFSHNDGSFNRTYSPEKDSAVAIHMLNN